MTWYQKNRKRVLACRKARYWALSIEERRALVTAQAKRRCAPHGHPLYLAREARYRNQNRAKINHNHRRWYRRAHPMPTTEELRSKRKFRHERRMLIRRIRQRIRKALLSARPKTIALLGCTPEFFHHYLESLFMPGMSWANRHLWHIDHKIAVSKFDLSTEEGQRVAFHYTNCQPLWATENQRKWAH